MDARPCRKEYESIRHMEGSVQMLRLQSSADPDMATIIDAAVRALVNGLAENAVLGCSWAGKCGHAWLCAGAEACRR